MTTPVKNLGNVTDAASNTAVQVLETIGTVATTATQTVGAITASVDMLSAFIHKARENQIAQHELEADDFYERLAEEAALERSERQAELQRKLNANPDIASHYAANYQHVSAITKRLKAERDQREARRLGTVASPAPVSSAA